MSHIREATNLDRDDVREVHLSAFPEGEREMVATLAVNLLVEATSPSTIALVAEIGEVVAGHIAFSPVTLGKNEKRAGYILAPLGVKPEFQKQRIGSDLIESGKKRLSESGVNVLLVYGDPKYYGRFGFSAGAASSYLPPYQLTYPHGWQAVALNEEEAVESTLKVSCVASLCDPELW
jgi:putative acetyltransferase